MRWPGFLFMILTLQAALSAETLLPPGVERMKTMDRDIEQLTEVLSDRIERGSRLEQAMAAYLIHRHFQGRRDGLSNPNIDPLQAAQTLLSASDEEIQRWGLLWLASMARYNARLQGETLDLLEKIEKQHRASSHRTLAAAIRMYSARLPEERMVSFFRELAASDRCALLTAACQAPVLDPVRPLLKPLILADPDLQVVQEGLRWLAQDRNFRLTPQQLLELLKRQHKGLTAQVASLLPRAGSDGGPAAHLAAASPDPEVRRQALAWATNPKTGSLGEWERRVLGLLAHDQEQDIAKQALLAWAPLANRQAGFDLEKAYRKAAQSQDPTLRSLAALVLAEFGTAPDRKTVVDALTSSDPVLRSLAIRGVVRLEDEGLLRELLDTVAKAERGPESQVGQAVWEALYKQVQTSFSDRLLNVLVSALASHETLSNRLTQLLMQGDDPGRRARLIPRLRPYLRHEAPQVRARVAKVAQPLGGPELAREFARDAEPSVRIAALTYAGAVIVDANALAALSQDASVEVRRKVAEGLHTFYIKESKAAALRMADDTDAQVRRDAAYSLLHFDDEQATRKFLACLRRDRYVDIGSELVRWRQRKYHAEVLLAALEVCDKFEQKTAVASLCLRDSIVGPVAALVERLSKELAAGPGAEGSMEACYRQRVKAALSSLTGLNEKQLSEKTALEKWLKDSAHK